ncbi:MAG: glycosyltransferase, partial [Epsilonproteobacteria bacterium]|nr:glycosyltransferase [Campylobacterota bacterium]
MSHKKTNLLYISGTKEGGIGTVVSGLNQYFNHRDDFKSSSIIMDSEDSKGRRHILVRFLKLTVLFRRYKKTADIIHVHGAWTPHVLFLKYIQGIPTVVSPHGALSKVSLEKSRVKKKIVKFLYMKKAYSKAECIHALTAQEAKEIMAYGIRDIPIAIIPNGIDFNETLNFERERKKELLDLANGRRIILSLSRL